MEETVLPKTTARCESVASAPASPSVDRPVLRYQLRTLLWITTILAVLAAVAGAFYRSVDPPARIKLLSLWSIVLVMAGVSYWLRIREATRAWRGQDVRFVVLSATSKRAARRLALALWGLLLAGFVCLVSYLAVLDEWHQILWEGAFLGSAIAGVIFAFSRSPLLLCEAGIPIGPGTVVPWRYIRYAQWVKGRPNVLKLRRFDGDIF